MWDMRFHLQSMLTRRVVSADLKGCVITNRTTPFPATATRACVYSEPAFHDVPSIHSGLRVLDRTAQRYSDERIQRNQNEDSSHVDPGRAHACRAGVASSVFGGVFHRHPRRDRAAAAACL